MKPSGTKMTIAKKGFFLAALPLVCGLIFYCVLFGLLLESEARTRDAVRSKQLVDLADDCLRQLIRCGFLLTSFAATHEDSIFDQYRSQIDEIPKKNIILNRMLKGAPDAGSREANEKVQNEWADTLKIIRRFEDVLREDIVEGFDDPRIPLLSRQLQVKTGNLLSLNRQLIDLEKRRFKNDPLWLHQNSHEGIKTALVICFLLNIAIAVWMIRYFAKNITGRLEQLTDNSKRVARGDDPLPPLVGSDEIAQLDADFHNMFDSLQEAAAKEKAIVENMPAGLVVVDSDAFIQSVNPRMLTLVNADAGPGQHLSELLTIPGVAGDQLLKTLSDKAMDRVAEVEACGGDGSITALEVSLTELQIGNNMRYLVNCLDVNDRREIEVLKQQFFEMVSHDLKTPLTSIRGVFDLLERGTYGELNASGMKQILAAAQSTDRLMKLVLDLLDIQKSEAGKVDLDLNRVDLIDLAHEAIASVGALARKHKIELVVEIKTNMSVVVDGDRVVQILVNMLSNALKFSPEHSRIVIAATPCDNDRFVEVSITDSGPGMTAEEQSKIFDKFKSIRSSNPLEAKGTGLGLAICKSLVQLHGGEIGVQSVPGEGSTFWFTLPRAYIDESV